MPNELLDDHKIPQLSLRKSYYDLFEYSIFICNILFLLVGIGGCWSYAISEKVWLLLINPPVFIVVFSVPTILFVKKWRHFSKAYEQGDTTQKWGDVAGFTLDFLHPVAGIVFNLACLIVSFFVFTNFSIGLHILVWGIAIVLGPLQYLYLRKIKQLLLQVKQF